MYAQAVQDTEAAGLTVPSSPRQIGGIQGGVHAKGKQKAKSPPKTKPLRDLDSWIASLNLPSSAAEPLRWHRSKAHLNPNLASQTTLKLRAEGFTTNHLISALTFDDLKDHYSISKPNFDSPTLINYLNL